MFIHPRYLLILCILAILLVVVFLGRIASFEEDYVDTSNKFLSNQYYQLLGVSVPNDCVAVSSAYSPAFYLGEYNMPPWNVNDSHFSNVYWIWNTANAKKDAPTNIFIWFYQVFYSPQVFTADLYAATDDIGCFYLNDTYSEIDISGGYPGTNTGALRLQNVNIKQGFNYVRVCAYNLGGRAGLILALKPSLYNAPFMRMVYTSSSWMTSTSSSYKQGGNVPSGAMFIYVAVDIGNRLVVKKDKEGVWTRIPTDTRSDLIFVTTGLDARTIIAVTTGNRIITKPSWIAPTWTSVPGDCCVTSLAISAFGRVYASGTDNRLYTKSGLNSTDWTQLTTLTTSGLVYSVAIDVNDTLYMIGSGNTLWSQADSHNLEQFQKFGCQYCGDISCCVKSMGIRADGYSLAVKTDGQLYEPNTTFKDMINSGWRPNALGNSGPVLSVCMPISYGESFPTPPVSAVATIQTASSTTTAAASTSAASFTTAAAASTSAAASTTTAAASTSATALTTSSYSPSYILGKWNMGPWQLSRASYQSSPMLENSFWIWNSPSAASNAPANQYIWFYHVFWNSSEANVTGVSFNACVDNVGFLYINDDTVGQAIDGGWPNRFSRTYPRGYTLKRGFNYIRVCAYNTGGPAGLYVNFGYIGTNYSWLTTTTPIFKESPMPPPSASFVYLAVGTDNRLYYKKSINDGNWRRVSSDPRSDLISVSTSYDGRMIIGVTTKKKMIIKASWTSPLWFPVSGDCCVLSVVMSPLGRVFAVGTDNKIWTKSGLLDTDWTQVASQEWCGSLAYNRSDNTIYVAGSDSKIYKKSVAITTTTTTTPGYTRTYYTGKGGRRQRRYSYVPEQTTIKYPDGTDLRGKNWTMVGNSSCCVKSLSFHLNDQVFCVGTDNQVYSLENASEIGVKRWNGPIARGSIRILTLCVAISYGDLSL